MADTTVPTSGKKRRGRQGCRGKTQKENAGAVARGAIAGGPSQADAPAANRMSTEVAAPKETDKKALSSPLGPSTVGKAKETVISITPSLPHDQGQSDGQPESSRARETSSPKGVKHTAKRGKRFLHMQLGSAQTQSFATNPGPMSYVQQAKGTPSCRSPAATTKPVFVAQVLPEKEFSEDHFPTLGSTGSVRHGKRTSGWAPSRNPERDEAERLALLRIGQQSAKVEGRNSWLNDPLNPINGANELPSSAMTPTHGAGGEAVVGSSTTSWMSGGDRASMFKAPYVFDESWKFGKPYKKQKSKLFMLATETLSTIFCRLDRRSRVGFARTSRASSTLIGILMTVWNMSDGSFCDAEKGPMGSGSPTAMTVITEFRGSSTKNVVMHEVKVLKTMTLAISLWTSTFKILEIYRAPLVTARLLSIVVPSLPNLEYLGVFDCELVHVGDSLILLEKMHNHVHFDFFPRRPICLDVNIVYLIALPAMLLTILPLAKRKNSRLIERGSAFARYLKLVLPNLPRKQYENIENKIQDAELTELITGWKEGYGGLVHVDPNSNNARYWECTYCGLELRGCFFARAQLKDRDHAMCWGCKLKDALDDEKTNKNLSGHRHGEINNWLGTHYRLDEAVKDIHKECKVQDAEKTFSCLQHDDRRAQMARKKFWNPRFYREAQAAWQKGEDPNDWWPDKQVSNRQNGRQAGRNRGGW